MSSLTSSSSSSSPTFPLPIASKGEASEDVYVLLSPFSQKYPVTVEGVTYPTIIHAWYAFFLSSSSTEIDFSQDLSILRHVLYQKERTQFRQELDEAFQLTYERLLSPSNDRHCQMDSLSLQSQSVSSQYKQCFRECSSFSLYYVESPSHVVFEEESMTWSNKSKKTFLQGWNEIGNVLELISHHQSRQERFSPYRQQLFEIYYLYQFLIQRFCHDGLSIENYIGKHVEECRSVYEHAFQHYLEKQIQFSLLDESFQEHIFVSFVNRRLAYWQLLEIECLYPGNIALWILHQEVSQVLSKIRQQTELLWIHLFAKDSLSSEYSSSQTDACLFQKSIVNVKLLSPEQRNTLVRNIRFRWETNAWKPKHEKDREQLQQQLEKEDMIQTLYDTYSPPSILEYGPRLFHFRPHALIVHDEVHKKVNLMNALPLPPSVLTFHASASLLRPSVPLSWFPEIHGYRLFFPTPFHYTYFQLLWKKHCMWMKQLEECTSPSKDKLFSWMMTIYSMILDQGVLYVDHYQELETTRVLPVSLCRASHFLSYPKDSELFRERYMLWLTEMKKRRLVQLLRLRVQQHMFLQQLLLSTSFLGWTSFHFSYSDSFLGYFSADLDEDFNSYQYHNVVGKSYDQIRQQLIQSPFSVHDQSCHMALGFVYLYVTPEEHSFDILYCQSMMLIECLELCIRCRTCPDVDESIQPQFTFLSNLLRYFPDWLQVHPLSLPSNDPLYTKWKVWETLTQHLKVKKNEVSLYLFQLWSCFLTQLQNKQLPLKAFS